MGTQGISLSSKILEHSRFAKTETVVHHKSHTGGNAISPHYKRLHRTQTIYLDKARILVETILVALREKGFASVLRSHYSYPHIFGIGEGITCPKLVWIAKIISIRSVSCSLVCGNLSVERQFIFAPSHDIFQRRKSLFGFISCI